ncbi:hypothetical protein GCM10023081_44520 [Arthrobacter ginkgonis]|uniref:Septum formation initiator n=1 Tax=Arthrobacter ginkgonis TaxID=1630594 RepID=A0ABP7DBC3_9MICC
MATRRPNMPRATGAGGPQDARTASGSGAGDAAPERLAKVIPLGAVPHTEDQHAQDPDTAARSGGGADRRAARPVPRPQIPRKGQSARKSQPAPAERPARASQPAPKSQPARKSQPAPKPAGRGAKGPASEQRARERAELSGAIRAGAATGGQEARPVADPEARPVPARTFSGRMLALALVLVTITVLLLPSVGTYARQRSELETLRFSIQAKTAEQADLKQQIARWDDPAYIKQQARDRINLVMPGERKYMVIGEVAEDEAVPVNESPNQVRTDLPWMDALWDTVKRSATD